MNPQVKKFNIGFITPLSETDAESFSRIVEAVCELGFNLSVILESDSETQTRCLALEKEYSNFKILENTLQNKEKILDNSNVILLFNESGKKTAEQFLSRGIVPIIPENCGFENFDAQSESGNAFTFERENFWQLLHAIIRASENYKFSYDWKNLQKNLQEIATCYAV